MSPQDSDSLEIELAMGQNINKMAIKLDQAVQEDDDQEEQMEFSAADHMRVDEIEHGGQHAKMMSFGASQVVDFANR